MSIQAGQLRVVTGPASNTSLHWFQFVSADQLRNIPLYIVEFDLTINAMGAATNVDATIGLCFSWNLPEANTYHSVQFRRNTALGNVVQVYNSGRGTINTGGWDRPLASNRHDVAPFGQQFHVKVTVDVANLTVNYAINGVEANDPATLSHYPDSPLSLLVYATEIEALIDNLYVYTPGTPPPATTAPPAGTNAPGTTAPPAATTAASGTTPPTSDHVIVITAAMLLAAGAVVIIKRKCKA